MTEEEKRELVKNVLLLDLDEFNYIKADLACENTRTKIKIIEKLIWLAHEHDLNIKITPNHLFSKPDGCQNIFIEKKDGDIYIEGNGDYKMNDNDYEFISGTDVSSAHELIKYESRKAKFLNDNEDFIKSMID